MKCAINEITQSQLKTLKKWHIHYQAKPAHDMTGRGEIRHVIHIDIRHLHRRFFKMIIHKITKQVMTCDVFPNENWTCDDNFVVVPNELEETAQSLSPFCILTLSDDNELVSIEDDVVKRENWNTRPIQPCPTTEQEQLRADVDYLLMLQGE